MPCTVCYGDLSSTGHGRKTGQTTLPLVRMVPQMCLVPQMCHPHLAVLQVA
jgi:hypothetical protein